MKIWLLLIDICICYYIYATRSNLSKCLLRVVSATNSIDPFLEQGRMEGFADVPRSSSGHFRSRPTGASHRRVNISVSQSIPALEREGRLGLSGSKTPASSGVEATNTSTIETKSARRGQQFIVFLLVLSCITKFTFDVVLNGISYDTCKWNFTKPTYILTKSLRTASLSPLNDLPQGFRLSRISTLYNPEEFYPYAISPKRKSNSPLNITVCLYITLEQLLAADQALSEWPGTYPVPG